MLIKRKNINRIAHYLLIYALLMFNGSIIYRNNQDVFLIIFLALGLGQIFKTRNNYQTQKLVIAMVPMELAMILTSITTRGSLSLGTILNITARFVFCYYVYSFNKIKFVPRYIKTVTFLAGISLVFFCLQLIAPSLITSLCFKSTYSEGIFYTNPLFTYALWHPKRNVGIMTEPGLYQIILNSALYLLLFGKRNINVIHRRFIYITIIIIAVITTQSTTGYIGLAIILLGYSFRNNHNNIGQRIKDRMYLMFAICFFTIIAIVFFKNISFIKTTIIDKIISQETGKIDFTVSTGKSRIVSMLTDLKVFQLYPLGCGYTIYSDIWKGLMVEHIGDSSSSAGITYSLAVFGILFWVCLWRFYILYGWKNKVDKTGFFILMAMVINTSFSQPLLYYPSLLCLFYVDFKYLDKIIYVRKRFVKNDKLYS